MLYTFDHVKLKKKCINSKTIPKRSQLNKRVRTDRPPCRAVVSDCECLSLIIFTSVHKMKDCWSFLWTWSWRQQDDNWRLAQSNQDQVSPLAANNQTRELVKSHERWKVFYVRAIILFFAAESSNVQLLVPSHVILVRSEAGRHL